MTEKPKQPPSVSKQDDDQSQQKGPPNYGKDAGESPNDDTPGNSDSSKAPRAK